MVEVESMLALVEAVPEVVLIRSFESSSWSLVLVDESLLERRFLRMQRDKVDMKPILDFGDLVCVCGGGIMWLGVLGLMLTLMELGIAGRVMGLRYMN